MSPSDKCPVCKQQRESRRYFTLDVSCLVLNVTTMAVAHTRPVAMVSEPRSREVAVLSLNRYDLHRRYTEHFLSRSEVRYVLSVKFAAVILHVVIPLCCRPLCFGESVVVPAYYIYEVTE